MIQFTSKEAIENFDSILEKALKANEETMIITENGNLVLVNEDQWCEIQQAMELLRQKKSLQALLEFKQLCKQQGQTSNQSDLETYFELLHDE